MRVASFGAGWVTLNRHVPAMRADGRFEVAALVDRRGERARDGAAEARIPRWAEASDVQSLEFAGEIDAVTCGTAPFGHHQVIKSALEAGKHVLTEKPFTMTVAEGEELVELARDRGLTLAIVHNFQFARSARQAQKWRESGRLGAIRAVWATQMSNPKRRLPDWFDDLPLGLFYDESPHLLYTTRALAGGGDIERVSVTAHPSTLGHANTPAQLDVQMRAGAIPLMLQMNFEAPLSEWHVAILGDDAAVVVDLFRDIALFVPNDGGHTTREVLRSSLRATLSHWGGYFRSGPGHLRRKLLYGNDEVFGRFASAIESGSQPEAIGPDDALAVLDLQHWIVEEAEAQLGSRASAGAP